MHDIMPPRHFFHHCVFPQPPHFQAHNPTNPELLDFADRQGMLFWVENRFMCVLSMRYARNRSRRHPPKLTNLSSILPPFSNKGVQPVPVSAKERVRAYPPFNAVADPQLLADAQAMVLRDRNHPSVVIWSLCNEGGCQIGTSVGASHGSQFKNVINYADTTRPITANGEWSIGTSDTMTNVMDVVTCSYKCVLGGVGSVRGLPRRH